MLAAVIEYLPIIRPNSSSGVYFSAWQKSHPSSDSLINFRTYFFSFSRSAPLIPGRSALNELKEECFHQSIYWLF